MGRDIKIEAYRGDSNKEQWDLVRKEFQENSNGEDNEDYATTEWFKADYHTGINDIISKELLNKIKGTDIRFYLYTEPEADDTLFMEDYEVEEE